MNLTIDAVIMNISIPHLNAHVLQALRPGSSVYGCTDTTKAPPGDQQQM